ncbi:hypothetical protein COV04_04555 [Candidatus Uhrbacteria bacterium CG10_big_fil_rev_8_21_14_0_10_48_11]|uniref:Uncharacterized protein n=1 Tax=Candidatus Uhrbacteria bacterium CG10_big_fil_rev_8_21_14_0_10_48_11 TaxID=1975037 RepID=A0A2M8LDF6_9BACT|nr:MAG: hypothetical protein COV04_04555 [Candidatus Uhrbacteria bacterium CG10_big_fil_rev_8_21_14_0_10_48_11]
MKKNMLTVFPPATTFSIRLNPEPENSTLKGILYLVVYYTIIPQYMGKSSIFPKVFPKMQRQKGRNNFLRE